MMRIKLNFTDIQCYSEPPILKSWFLLDTDDITTVADLAKELTRKFRLKCNSDRLLLTLDDCLLPDWESTQILRDDDTIRVQSVQDSCQSKHKKRKRHVRNDESEYSSLNYAADLTEPAMHNAESSTVLVSPDHVSDDQSQDCRIKVKKKKKKKRKYESHCHNDDHGEEDRLTICSTDFSSRKKQDNVARHCEEALVDCQLNSSQNHRGFTDDPNGMDYDNQLAVASDPLEVEPSDRVQNNSDHQIYPETVLNMDTSVEHSSMAASSPRAKSQVNDNSLVSNEQQLKPSQSAKRRTRRRRVRKGDPRKLETDLPNNEQRNNTLATIGTSPQNVSGSNLPVQTSHSVASGLGRTHIIFEDSETGCSSHPATPVTCDRCESQTLKGRDLDCDSVVADSIVSSNSNVETFQRLQYGNSVSNSLTCSNVNKESSASCLPVETKVRHPLKHAQLANVQVFCRQRIKKSAPDTHMPNIQAADTVTSQLSQDNAQKQVPAIKDYSQCCCLQGTPRAGDLIAYKVLEMTDDYTPALSQYKEATVVEFDPLTNVVVLQGVMDSGRKRTPGRFDVSIEYEDEILTNVCQNSETSLLWTALHDVRLLKKC